MNANFTSSKPHHPGLFTTIRHALALVSFTLLSAFSGAAISGTVHKCLQANGLYEYSDKKCVPVAPTASQQQSAPVTDTQNSEVKQTDSPHADAISQPHEAAHAPLEARTQQTPNTSAVPASAPQTNNVI
jgi:hypothetical protein